MTPSDESRMADDPYNLHRFVHAQAANYAHALAEMKGRVLELLRGGS